MSISFFDAIITVHLQIKSTFGLIVAPSWIANV